MYIFDHMKLSSSQDERYFRKKFVEKITTPCRLWDNLETHDTARQATDDYYNMGHVRYMLDN